MNQRTIEFLSKLEALYVEYDMSIGGCGCCGSPWLETVKNEYLGDDVNFKNGVLTVDGKTLAELVVTN